MESSCISAKFLILFLRVFWKKNVQCTAGKYIIQGVNKWLMIQAQRIIGNGVTAGWQSVTNVVPKVLISGLVPFSALLEIWM